MHKHERGMSFWPFVITLILLLIFIFMWFSSKSDTDDALKLKATAEAQTKLKSEEATALTFYIDRLAKVVGWQDTKAPIQATDEKGTVIFKYEKPVPNVAEIEKALSLETEGGPLAAIRAASTVKVANKTYQPSKGAAAGDLGFKKLAPNLKAKVDEVMAQKPGAFPSKPDDPGDAAAVAKYEADKKAWEEQFKKYSAALEAIVKEPGYEQYALILGDTGGLYDPEKPGVIDWSFWEKPASAYTSLEEFMAVPAPILRNMRDSYVDRVKNDITQIDSLTAALAEKEKVIDNAEEAKSGLKQLLDKEQQIHSADVARLQAEAQTQRDAAEKSRVAATGAETTLATERERAKTEAAKLAQTIGAQKNALAGQKERYNLAVQRDEPDGALLSADPALGIAYVNLGSQDQLSVGTKFSVWVIGRGGQKVPKGDIVVTKVLDSHYSQARIASTALGERPLAPGDMISNPFYDKRKPIHVYLAGDLKKYPRAIAVARLGEMGAVVDKEINDKTDWIVLPDSVTAGEKAPAEGAAPDATAPKEESPLARYERLARTFGATLITERVIEAFLDY